MWRPAFLILNIVVLSQIAQATPPTSTGPTTENEARFLAKRGGIAFENQEYDEVIRLLQRLVDRYPADPTVPHSKLLLGQAYLKKNDPQKALLLLKDLSELSGNPPKDRTAQAKLALGKAYLLLKKADEAFLIAAEVDKKFGPEYRPFVRLIQVESSLMRKHQKEAEKLLGELTDSTPESRSKKIGTEILPEAEYLDKYYELRLRTKLGQCESLLGSSGLTESQIAHQMRRKTLCVLDALNEYPKLQKYSSEGTLTYTTGLLARSFDNLDQTCRKIPALGAECTDTFRKALDRLQVWGKGGSLSELLERKLHG